MPDIIDNPMAQPVDHDLDLETINQANARAAGKANAEKAEADGRNAKTESEEAAKRRAEQVRVAAEQTEANKHRPALDARDPDGRQTFRADANKTPGDQRMPDDHRPGTHDNPRATDRLPRK